MEQPHNRFSQLRAEAVDDGWTEPEQESVIRTHLMQDPSRSLISWNNSPDLPFDRSINPFKGCEHGCIYCFARPTHAYLDLSPGLDFETRIFFKPNAAELLRRELSSKSYRCAPIGIGTNTDPWQPAERKLGITRQILEVLSEFNHPVTIVTKSTGIERDLDILQSLAERGLVLVHMSICTLDTTLSRRMEPRAAAPGSKLVTLEKLVARGIPTGLIFAPVIPVLNDSEIERVLESSAAAGASFAHYIMLRLPHEVAPLFRSWLEEFYPLKKDHIMNRVQDLRGGKDYRASFGERLRGRGVFARLIEDRFNKARERLSFGPEPELDTSQFQVPGTPDQLTLFS